MRAHASQPDARRRSTNNDPPEGPGSPLRDDPSRRDLTDADHHLLALWAATCAGHVLDLFESAQPEDPRPRQAIEHARAWVRGEVKMTQSSAAGGHAMGAARDLRGAARHAAYAAGQAGAVAHVAAHELGAAAYAIKAARAATPGGEGEGEAAGRSECQWQRDQLPAAIRELVLDDQRLRNGICWSVFDSERATGQASPASMNRLQIAVIRHCASSQCLRLPHLAQRQRDWRSFRGGFWLRGEFRDWDPHNPPCS